MLVDELGEASDQPRALAGGQHSPRTVLKRLPRRSDGVIDVLRAGLRDGGDRASGGRIKRLERGAVGGGDALAPDQQLLLAPGELPRGAGKLIGERAYGHAISSRGSCVMRAGFKAPGR